MRRLVVAAAAMLVASGLAAAQLRIFSVAPGTSCGGIVHVEHACQGQCETQAADFRFSTPATIDIGSVPPPWKVRAESGGCWSPLVTLTGDASPELPLWRAAEATVKLRPPDRAMPPVKVSIEVVSPPGTRGTAVPRTSVACRSEDPVWRCSIPATETDLRIAADDYVPIYRWGVRPPGRNIDLGEHLLRHGASVAGWIGSGAKDCRLRDAVVKLVQEAVTGPSGDALRLAQAARSATVNARGFFQFAGVPPGSYHVLASTETCASPNSESLAVVDTREYRLADSLALHPLVTIDAMILPPWEPSGGLWQVKLRRSVPLSNYVTDTEVGMAGPDGRWKSKPLAPGKYWLLLLDAAGTEFSRNQVDVLDVPVHVDVHVDKVAVKGRVTAGDRPLKAKLEFTKVTGGKAKLQSDEEGRFTGVLPEEGRWSVRVFAGERFAYVPERKVMVKRPEGSAVANVDITLPGGRVKGIVLEGDAPAADVTVFVMQNGQWVGTAGTNAEGAFEAFGLEPGPAQLQAQTRDSESETVPYDVTENNPPVARLVIERRRKVEGIVIGIGGDPVPGALIRYKSPDGFQIKETVSGLSGEFAMSIPPRAPFLDVVVIAPAYATKLVAFTPPPRGQRIELALHPQGALLTVLFGRTLTASWPWVRYEKSGWINLRTLLGPPDGSAGLRALRPGGVSFEVEPGNYTVCDSREANARCETKLLSPRTEVVFEASK